MTYIIRKSENPDLPSIIVILREVADRVPLNLSTESHINAMSEAVAKYLGEDSLSLTCEIASNHDPTPKAPNALIVQRKCALKGSRLDAKSDPGLPKFCF